MNSKLPLRVPDRKGVKLTRRILSFLLFIIALNAFAGGYYGMAGARNVPVDWLNDTPFQSYFIPGLILFTLVGGSNLISAILMLIHHRLAAQAAMVSGIVILVWIDVQVNIIGYVSWMQPVIAVIGLLIIMLSIPFGKTIKASLTQS